MLMSSDNREECSTRHLLLKNLWQLSEKRHKSILIPGLGITARHPSSQWSEHPAEIWLSGGEKHIKRQISAFSAWLWGLAGLAEAPPLSWVAPLTSPSWFHQPHSSTRNNGTFIHLHQLRCPCSRLSLHLPLINSCSLWPPSECLGMNWKGPPSPGGVPTIERGAYTERTQHRCMTATQQRRERKKQENGKTFQW